MSKKKFIFDLQRFADIYNANSNTLLSGTSDDDYVANGYRDTRWHDGGNNVTMDAGAGNDDIYNGESSQVSIEGGDGNDYLDGGNGDDSLEGHMGNDTLLGNNGEFYEDSYLGRNVTINAGAGNDLISLNSDSKNTVIQYKSGDGNDTIYGFNATTSLQIGGGIDTYSTQRNGGDIIVTVGEGKITLKDAVNTIVEEYSKWTLSGTTAKYGTSSKTLATVKGVKSLDGLSLSGKVVTVSKASLGTDKVTISGDGYTLKLGSDATKASATNAWSLSGTTATYNQTTTAGYTLAKNAITYSKKSTTPLATIKGVKSKNGLSVNGKVIELKNSALKGNVTVSGGYEFDFQSDYKQAKITGSSSADTITARGVKVTINGGASNDTIKLLGSGSVSGGADTLLSGAGNDVLYGDAGNDSLRGGAGKDTLVGGAGNDVLYGDAGNDSLWGGAGNDKLYGGAGNDVFIYKPGEGTDTIFDYSAGDILKIFKKNGKEGGTFSKSSFSNGNLTLTISGSGSVVFSGVSSGDKININGTTHTISGKTLK